MVDPESVISRLARLAQLLEQLERARTRGADAYLADDDLQAATERRLQLAEQICIDVGAHLLSERNARPASDYADIFTSLAEAGELDRGLASRMVQAARQRNVLVHSYLEVDAQKILESLDHLDDLRSFAAAVQRVLDRERAQP